MKSHDVTVTSLAEPRARAIGSFSEGLTFLLSLLTIFPSLDLTRLSAGTV